MLTPVPHAATVPDPRAHTGCLVLARPDRIGDVILASCCIGPARSALPGSSLYFLAARRMAGLFHQHPALDGFLPLEDPPDVEALADRLRAIGADAVVHLQPDPTVVRAAARAGIERRLGWDGPARDHLTEVRPDPRRNGEVHEARCCLDLLGSLGIEAADEPRPWLTPDPAARDAVRACGLPLRYAVVHVAAHGDKPRVPLSFFAAVAGRLASRHDATVVVVGRDDEPAAVEALGLASGGRVLDLTGRANLAETAWVAAGALVTVSRDSGPAHLAAAMGCPTVTLFPEPSPSMRATRWRPLGPVALVYEKPVRARRWRGRDDLVRRSLRRFDADEIVALVDEAVERGVAERGA